MFEAIGEYYLPNFMYPTNSLLGGRPFEFPVIADLCTSWQTTLAGLPDTLPDMPDPVSEWIKKAKSIQEPDLKTQPAVCLTSTGPGQRSCHRMPGMPITT